MNNSLTLSSSITCSYKALKKYMSVFNWKKRKRRNQQELFYALVTCLVLDGFFFRGYNYFLLLLKSYILDSDESKLSFHTSQNKFYIELKEFELVFPVSKRTYEAVIELKSYERDTWTGIPKIERILKKELNLNFNDDSKAYYALAPVLYIVKRRAPQIYFNSINFTFNNYNFEKPECYELFFDVNEQEIYQYLDHLYFAHPDFHAIIEAVRLVNDLDDISKPEFKDLWIFLNYYINYREEIIDVGESKGELHLSIFLNFNNEKLKKIINSIKMKCQCQIHRPVLDILMRLHSKKNSAFKASKNRQIKSIRYLSASEVDCLLEAALNHEDKDYGIYFILMLFFGMRPSDPLKIKKSQIKDNRLVFRTYKTNQSLLGIINALIPDKYLDRFIQSISNISTNKRLISKDKKRESFLDFMRKALGYKDKEESNCNLYMLRKTFATHMFVKLKLYTGKKFVYEENNIFDDKVIDTLMSDEKDIRIRRAQQASVRVGEFLGHSKSSFIALKHYISTKYSFC